MRGGLARRIGFKFLWAAVLILLLTIFSEVRHEFVYQAF